ncbi:MAG TPA: hypothetical protein VJC18_10970, partial [bacterium]|nr:hypothetical protein [bacterium]
ARLPVIVRNFQSEENGQADDQDTFTIQTHDGQIVESSQGKIVAVVEGMLQSPTFEFVQSSGPDVVIEAPQITNFGDKLKLVSHITAPKYEPNNSRAFIKLTVTDQDITKSATTMLAIMPKEKELNKQDVSNMSGQILGVNGDGDLIKLVKEPGNGEMLSIVWLSPTVKLYVSNTAVVQTITIGDYVVLSDYTFQHNRGAIVAFNMPKLKRTEYYLYDAVANSYPGIKSYVAPNEGDRAGYVLDKGDLDGDGTEEVWALLPMGENGAGIFVFSLETMVAISRFVESPFNEFSKLLTIADINADTKADLNTGTVAYDSNLVTADDIDSQGQYNAADQIMSFLSSGTEKGVLQMADMSASFEIKPQFPELTPKYKGLIKTATMGGANGLIELTTDLDFNNDAADDIATADSNFLISFYFGSPESEETMASMSIDLSEAVDAILSMAAGDVTGDGVDDLVLGCNDGIIIIIPGSTLYPEEAQLSEDDLIIIFADAGVDVDNMVVADTNGDGIDDITFYDDGKDNTTVIDTYDNFGGNNDNTGNNTTAPVFAGKLSGVAGCSLNPTIVVFSETYHDYLTVAMLLLVLLCVRLRRGTS